MNDLIYEIFNYFNNPEDQFLVDELSNNQLVDVVISEILEIINNLKELIEQAEYEEQVEYEDYHETAHFACQGYGWRTKAEI